MYLENNLVCTGALSISPSNCWVAIHRKEIWFIFPASWCRSYFPRLSKNVLWAAGNGWFCQKTPRPLCPGYRQPLDFLSKKLFANNLNKNRNCAAFGRVIPNAHQAKMCYINKDSQKQHLRCYIERPKHSVNEIDLEMVQMVWWRFTWLWKFQQIEPINNSRQ